MVRCVAVLSVVLALLAVLAAGFGAEAARAEGKFVDWDNAVNLGRTISSYTATQDGFLIVPCSLDDATKGCKVISARGITTDYIWEEGSNEWDKSTWTIPLSKGDKVVFSTEISSGDIPSADHEGKGRQFANSYFVPSGGAAVDDGVRLMFFYLVTDTIILRSEQGVQPPACFSSHNITIYDDKRI